MTCQDTSITESIRAFNRYYTNKIGILNNRLYGTRFSLTEARIIFHAGEKKSVTAGEMARLFRLDPGYTSRVIKKLVKADVLKKERSKQDTRIHYLSLSLNGKKVLSGMIQISNNIIENMLQPLSLNDRQDVVGYMNKLQMLLEKGSEKKDIFTIRMWRPGDLSYVVSGHMKLYGKEHHFDGSFEYYVGTDVMAFGQNFDPERENLWIAENRSRKVGSIAIVNNGDDVAQLRWLIVDACARGNGLGEKLVETAVTFAKEKQYKKIILMTTDFLTPARKLYEKFGFKQTSSEKESKWGRSMYIEYLALEF